MTSKKNHQLHSMTGFGKAQVTLNGCRVDCEIRTLNSRNTDINVKLDQKLKSYELILRKKCQEGLLRGKIDLSISMEPIGNEKGGLQVTEAFEKRLHIMQNLLNKNFDSQEEVSTQMAWQLLLKEDLWNVAEQNVVWDEEDIEKLQKCLDDAIGQTMDFRQTEGRQIHIFLDQELTHIEQSIPKVKKLLAARGEQLREGLERHMQEIKDLDSHRFEQEILYYLDKWDVTEELVRLAAHCTYFRTTMNAGVATGKKLQFITQEIGREINTLGAKASFAPIQHLVVNMKENLEKIKEQIANVL